jgi:hypothetical protein
MMSPRLTEGDDVAVHKECSCGQLGLRLAQLADDLLWGMSLLQLRESSFYPSGAVGLS